MTNPDGTYGPQHVTSEGIELEPEPKHHVTIRSSGTGYFQARCYCGASAGGFTSYAEAYGYATEHEEKNNEPDE